MADPSTTVLVGVWKTAKKLRDVLAHSDRAREASEKLRSKMNSCIAVLDLLRLPITPSASEMPSDDLGVFRAAAEDIQATLTRCERIIGKFLLSTRPTFYHIKKKISTPLHRESV